MNADRIADELYPALELLRDHLLAESLAYGNSLHAKSFKVAIGIIEAFLKTPQILIPTPGEEYTYVPPAPPQPNNQALSSPGAITDEERKEMLKVFDRAFDQEPFTLKEQKAWKNIRALISAPSQPKKVSRENVTIGALRIILQRFKEWDHSPKDWGMLSFGEYVILRLRELGIEVSDEGEKP